MVGNIYYELLNRIEGFGITEIKKINKYLQEFEFLLEYHDKLLTSSQPNTLLMEGGVELAKSLGINKRLSRKIANSMKQRNKDQAEQEVMKIFENKFSSLISWLNTISIKTKAMNENSDRLTRKFNVIHRVKRPDTKIKRVIDKLQEMKSLDLISNNKLQQLKSDKETEETKPTMKVMKPSKTKDILFDRADFVVKYPDARIFRIIEEEDKKSETTYFEFKKELNQKKNIEIAERIAAMANTDSGIFVFGWDETSKSFYDIDVEDVEQRIVNWNKNLIKPPISLEFVKTRSEGKRILLVLVPVGKEIRGVRGRFPKRDGSQKRYMSPREISKYEEKREKTGIGHLYLSYLEQMTHIKIPKTEKGSQHSDLYQRVKQIVYAKRRKKEQLSFEEWNVLKNLSREQIKYELTKRVRGWLLYYRPELSNLVSEINQEDDSK